MSDIKLSIIVNEKTPDLLKSEVVEGCQNQNALPSLFFIFY